MIVLSAGTRQLHATIPLPASKSESNRALIIQALSQAPITLDNLASARDTRTLIRLLESEGHVLDVIDAGTTMRFLTAYCAAAGRDQILTGTPRMCQRPIGILVDALRTLGADIQYYRQEGYPPLHIVSKGTRLTGGKLRMAGHVSSQFISAILMIAPVLTQGLRLELEGSISSRPYIEMTRAIMAHFGVQTTWEAQTLVIPEQAYQAGHYQIESDWSAASYWYSMAALAESADITLKGLRQTSWQGDARIAELMVPFGVHTEYLPDGVRLTRREPSAPGDLLDIDFSDTPDLAQTLAVVSAGTGIPLRMRGLHTLRVKETDRIEALRTELERFGVHMEVVDDVCTIRDRSQKPQGQVHTYDDHRMAMAFAPLALRHDQVELEQPEVVVKSYPEFWDHLALAGLRHTEW
ncbi:MAG: 3-phosphoshikimate 1-carboxyvinyltransferase [Bacteroidetes bacterium]|nr:MAG: 3-phosphoshikimate 1-carboxyvinyltransferase [Bacteroidota bacterium]